MPTGTKTLRRKKSAATTPAPDSTPLPHRAGLMLCQLVDQPFDHPDWIFEPKLDGLRALCRCDGHAIEIISRNDKSQTHRFPEVAGCLRKAVKKPALLDGEIVCLDDAGRSSFHQIQQRFGLENPAVIAQRAAAFPALLFVFDILHFDGHDLTGLPLSQRKKILARAVRPNDCVRLTPVWPEQGRERHADACRRSEEGIVGKRLDSTYVAARNGAWVKIKCVNRQEFVIGGYTDPQRSRVGFGALLLGYFDSAGKLVYAGKVGTGYSDALLTSLLEKLNGLASAANPFNAGVAPGDQGVHWVKPRLVCEIGFAEWTQDGLVRQGRFKGLREDKDARSVRREQPEHVAAAGKNKDGKHLERNVKTSNKTATGGSQTSRSSKRNPAEQPKEPAGDEAQPLDTYRQKRRFNATPEPSGTARRSAPAAGHSFVIQEHHASHLHYDLRLEVDGVLKSWAVPKEPVMDVAVKRLAVQVEDHPLEYATFHGDIPQGEYGGGHVEIWDSGAYENLMAEKNPPLDMPAALEAGHLEFALHGQRLHGAFAMVRMKGPRQKANWLLIKMKDAREGGGPDPAGRTAANPDAPGAAPARAAKLRKPPKHAAHPHAAATHSNAAKGTTAAAAPGIPEFTHVDKVLFPETGVTKGDVLKYYLSVADRLLPWLKDRPITVERLPDGVQAGAPQFWQKNTPTYYPDYIPRITLADEHGKHKKIDYALINNVEALLYFVNAGALTFHTWFSHVGSLDKPGYVLFDFDIGPADFADCVTAAKNLRKLLEDQRLDPVVKTSGKSGLHVLAAPPQPTFEAARGWAMDLALQLVKLQPAALTVERSKEKRQGRIYVDVMQNGKGKHVVPPYVLRPTPLATVSMPLEWKDITASLDVKKYTLAKAQDILDKRKTDPLEPPRAALG